MPALDPRIAFLQTLMPAPVANQSAQITPETRAVVDQNIQKTQKAVAASPVGQFATGFSAMPGEGVASGNPYQSIGDSVANATPAGGMASGIEHLPSMIGQASHALPQLMAHAAPALGAIGSLNIIGKGEKAGKTAEAVVDKMPMITKNKADPKSVASYLSVFDVPRRIAQNMQVKPEQVIHQLVDDGITNVKSLDELETHARNITGGGNKEQGILPGAFPQINNYILSAIKKPIPYEDALNSITNLKTRVLEGEKPGFVNDVMNEVHKSFEPVNYNGVGLQGGGYAKDLFQVSQNLREIGRMYQRQAHTDMGELNHPEIRRASQAIMDIKNSVDKAIDDNVPPDVYKSFKQDPFVQEQLARVPQKVSERWMQGANRFKDGQTIQAPYVNLQNMIDDTRDTQMSVWTKAAKAMQNQNTSGGVRSVVEENTPGPKIVKNVVGNIAGAVAKPFDKSPEDLFAEATSGKSGDKSGTSGLPGGKTIKAVLPVAGTLGVGLLAGKAFESSQQKSNAEGKKDAGLDKYYHDKMISYSPVNVKDTPISQDSIKSDTPISHPSVIKGSNGSLAISEDQYNNTISDLQALKNDPAYQIFPKSAQLQAAIDTVTNKHAQSKPLLDKYDQATSLYQKIENARELLKDTSPWGGNALPGVGGISQGIQTNTDPKYKQLMNDFAFIESNYPGLKGTLTNSNLVSKDSINASLDQAYKMIVGDYYNTIHKFAGTGGGDNIPTPNSQVPVSQAGGLPPVNGASVGGSGFQPMPANPLLQQ